MDSFNITIAKNNNIYNADCEVLGIHECSTDFIDLMDKIKLEIEYLCDWMENINPNEKVSLKYKEISDFLKIKTKENK